jgi:hypothetical protein
MPQTCFCCVLETQRDENSAALLDGRRDDVAAEMLRVLARPFMVWSQHVLSCIFAFASGLSFKSHRRSPGCYRT